MSLARRVAALLLAGGCLFAGAAAAQATGSPDPNAAPQADGELRDPVFGVHGPEFGLARHVEMYQWVPREGGHARGWSESPLDGGDADGAHANPPFPLESRRWLPDEITVDGYPLSAEVLERFGTWREFRPAFSALPGNLSATFQPEGDGLGSAENPLAPEVGDLRIHWRERVLPPLAGRIEVRDGAWRLRVDTAADPVGEPAGGGVLGWLPIVAGGLLLLVLAVALGRRRR